MRDIVVHDARILHIRVHNRYRRTEQGRRIIEDILCGMNPGVDHTRRVRVMSWDVDAAGVDRIAHDLREVALRY